MVWNANIMDDPINVPSLLVAPYLGYCAIDDEVTATRRTILSPEIHIFAIRRIRQRSRKFSPTFYRYIWPIALSKVWQQEIRQRRNSADQLADGGTGHVHESFHPTLLTNGSLNNMMFCELVLDYLDIR